MAKIYIPTFGEEVGNSISHGVMSILMLLAMPFAAVWSYTHSGGDVLRVVGVSVFCISIFMMFLISTLGFEKSSSFQYRLTGLGSM
jgi:hemolysin III